MKSHISIETAKVIKERRELKQGGLSSSEQWERYSQLSREVQRRCRQDYNAYINNICEDLEQHSLKHETKDLINQKLKLLTRSKPMETCVVKDERWATANGDGSRSGTMAKILRATL
ncbi:unnamed protein product, partial [Iphiclides podalirius]